MWKWPIALQLIVFLLLVVAGIAVFSSLALIIVSIREGASVLEVTDYLNPYSENVKVEYLKIYQILSHIGMFLLPALVMAFYSSDSVRKYLYFKNPLKLNHLILGGLFMLVIVPWLNYIIVWNANLQLPEHWEITKWMVEQEESAKFLTELFLNDTSTKSLLVNLFMIAIIPAFSEEFVFRGFLFRIFSKYTNNKHVIVLITSILFSAMHMQFYGFFPRFILGIIMGYLLVYSGNMLVPMLAHFVNNSTAVLASYYAAKQGTLDETDTLTFMDGNITIIALSIILTIGIAYYFIINKGKEINTDTLTEKKDFLV
jgi:membrane protease YdiL (CAAX protease family)